MTKPIPPLTAAEIADLARFFHRTPDAYLAELHDAGPRVRVSYSRGARFILATLSLTHRQRKALPRDERMRLVRAAEALARPTPDAEEASR